jgi:hypothetical protein
LLKKVTGTVDIVPSPLPLDVPQVLVPEAALDRRVTNKNNRIHHQLLIKWEGMPPELVTWEDEDDILQRFSDLSAWGQAAAKGEEMLRTLGPVNQYRTTQGRSEPGRPTRSSPAQSGARETSPAVSGESLSIQL